jgi:hypothetical protein
MLELFLVDHEPFVSSQCICSCIFAIEVASLIDVFNENDLFVLHYCVFLHHANEANQDLFREFVVGIHSPNAINESNEEIYRLLGMS